MTAFALTATPTAQAPTVAPAKTVTPPPTNTPDPYTGWLVFESTRYDTNQDGAIDFQDGAHIYTLDLAAGEERQLTSGPQKDLQPTWSPDRSQIGFVSNRYGENYDLFIMNADGSDVRQITDTDENEEMPAWSPDGNEIAFVRVTTLENGLQVRKLFSYSADAGVRQMIVGSANDYSPAWSPDGRYLAFTRMDTFTDPAGESYNGIVVCLLEVGSGIVYQLTSTHRESGKGYFQDPHWLPRSGYYLSMSYVPEGESPFIFTKIFELKWEGNKPVLYQALEIDDITVDSWGARGEWLITVLYNSSPLTGTGIDSWITDIAYVQIPWVTSERQFILDPADQRSTSLDIEQGDWKLITNDLFRNNHPEWVP